MSTQVRRLVREDPQVCKTPPAKGTPAGRLLRAQPHAYIILRMWLILEHRRVDRKLSGHMVPLDVLKRYEKWKDIVRLSGPAGLRRIKGFHDEALKGDWHGHRSSRLNLQWRVIYCVEGDRLLVKVMEVTAHDYRKK